MNLTKLLLRVFFAATLTLGYSIATTNVDLAMWATLTADVAGVWAAVRVLKSNTTVNPF
jgi:hypothetical protein